jgi:hypothetical protein
MNIATARNTNISEIVVTNPKPRPDRPKICCSKGAELNAITMIFCISNTKKMTVVIFKKIFVNNCLRLNNTKGRRNIEALNITINLGIIIPSLFAKGVTIKVFTTAE